MSLTAGELTQIRDEMAASLPDTCTIRRVTPVATETGGWTETTVDTSVACRVAPLGSRDAQIAGAMGYTSDHVVTLPAETDVRASDRIVWNGQTFEVNGPPRTRSEELVRRVYVRGGA